MSAGRRVGGSEPGEGLSVDGSIEGVGVGLVEGVEGVGVGGGVGDGEGSSVGGTGIHIACIPRQWRNQQKVNSKPRSQM